MLCLKLLVTTLTPQIRVACNSHHTPKLIHRSKNHQFLLYIKRCHTFVFKTITDTLTMTARDRVARCTSPKIITDINTEPDSCAYKGRRICSFRNLGLVQLWVDYYSQSLLPAACYSLDLCLHVLPWEDSLILFSEQKLSLSRVFKNTQHVREATVKSILTRVLDNSGQLKGNFSPHL